MAGRCTYPWPTLAILACLAFAPAAFAAPDANVLHLQSTAEDKSPAGIRAQDIFTWTDGVELVYALVGDVVIEHDRCRIKTDRAVIWVDAKASRKRRPVRVVVYADAAGGRKAVVDTTGVDPQETERALVEFVTPAIGRISGRVHSISIADSDQYRSGQAARGRPLPPLKQSPPLPPDHPAPAIKATQFAPLPGSPEAVKNNTVLPVPLTETRSIWISPRTSRPFNYYPFADSKERGLIVTGGIKLIATFTTGSIRSVELQADQVVIWKRDGDTNQTFDAMRSEDGAKNATGLELYLTGNVIVRIATPKDKAPQGIQIESRTIRAERVYYDLDSHKAIAIRADLEYTREKFVNAGHIVASEIHQLSSTEFTAFEAVLHASRLPSDPGFKVEMDQADVYQEPKTVRRTIFGLPFRDRRTGKVVEEEPQILEIQDMSLWTRYIPFFYLPYARTELNDPFGPFQGVTFRQDRIFGFQAYASWDMLKLVGLTPLENERWSLLTDYLSERGPGLGTNYNLAAQKFFGMDAPYQTLVKGYIMYDRGEDQLGGPREMDSPPAPLRGRFLWQHQQQFTLAEPEDLTLQAQLGILSDRNFLEQSLPDGKQPGTQSGDLRLAQISAWKRRGDSAGRTGRRPQLGVGDALAAASGRIPPRPVALRSTHLPHVGQCGIRPARHVSQSSRSISTEVRQWLAAY